MVLIVEKISYLKNIITNKKIKITSKSAINIDFGLYIAETFKEPCVGNKKKNENKKVKYIYTINYP